MSPKSNKKLKKFPSEEAEQLDLVETISDVDKLRKNVIRLLFFYYSPLVLVFLSGLIDNLNLSILKK